MLGAGRPLRAALMAGAPWSRSRGSTDSEEEDDDEDEDEDSRARGRPGPPCYPSAGRQPPGALARGLGAGGALLSASVLTSSCPQAPAGQLPLTQCLRTARPAPRTAGTRSPAGSVRTSQPRARLALQPPAPCSSGEAQSRARGLGPQRPAQPPLGLLSCLLGFRIPPPPLHLRKPQTAAKQRSPRVSRPASAPVPGLLTLPCPPRPQPRCPACPPALRRALVLSFLSLTEGRSLHSPLPGPAQRRGPPGRPQRDTLRPQLLGQVPRKRASGGVGGLITGRPHQGPGAQNSCSALGWEGSVGSERAEGVR